MSQSAHADPSHGPADEIAAARARWSAPASRTGAASGPQAVLLGLQASAGNAAVVGLLRSRAPSTLRPLESARVAPLPVASHAPTAPVLVSRDEDEDAPSDEQQSDPGQVITGFEGGDSDAGAGEGSAPSESASSEDSAAGEGASADESQASSEGSAAEGESGAYDESAASGESDDSGESAASGDAGEYGESAASGESDDSGESAAEGESGDPGEASAEGGEEEASGDDGDQEHSADEQAEKEAEGQTGIESDEPVASGGGAYPIAAAGPGGGFVDSGRVGTVPFTEAQLDTFDPDHDREPHAFAAGGRTGTKAWAGGGGAGPKGNQESGSIQNQVVPDYDSSWGGLFSNASAWVIEGTGIADVTRNYVTSDAGDQGNGWWISAKAASALEAHEQRHVASSKDLYDQHVQPVLDRIANSRALGADKTYKSSDAKALLSRQISWKSGLEAFKESDQGNNAPNMMLDTNDTASGALPRPQHGPRKIGGKDFDNYLIMLSEPDPT